jgi:hypothetical protein
MVFIKTLHFKKGVDKKWYIILPEWLGMPEDLEMTSGADIWLDMISRNSNDCVLAMSEGSFEGAHAIELLAERTVEQGGGADYVLKVYNGERINLKMWLCDVTSYVWRKLPEVIYFRVK